MRQNLGKIEAIRHKVRTQATRQRAGFLNARRSEGGLSTVFRLTGAVVRAVLVMLMVAIPSLLLPEVAADTKQMVALVALFLGVLTLVEYAATYPSLIEFRDAPPFNRIRFLAIFLTVLVLSLIAKGQTEPTKVSLILEILGGMIGRAIDFPFSPVRLVLLAVSEDVGTAQLVLVRTAAGLSYLVSLAMLTIFVLCLRSGNWPARGSSFNVWVNLPTFDPTAGGDVIYRLERDARVNIALGFLLPFLVPAVVKAATSGIAPVTLSNPQVLIWTMAAWSFLPASLFMRGIAMGRLADMIRVQRRAAAVEAEEKGAVLAHA
ncbi:hypothetical protein SAMN05421774_105209 [Gemmobacter megaterium]|uniref:Uncharacterized protein n=1 Tax=Gemmobacter megaterium TaxID=1086013 RepID=A0A1N7PFC1_9RHOB|nr:hypothetical protein SAMN05421774_105209 [Gemmobacter megaterium]